MNKDELLSRRSIFKKAAKSILPVIGAIVLPSSLLASENRTLPNPQTCNGSCTGLCTTSCTNGCKGECKGCQGSC